MDQLLNYVQTGGTIGSLVLILWLLWKGELIWKRDHQEIVRAKDASIARLEQALEKSQNENRGWIEKALAKLDRLEQAAGTGGD